MIVNLLFITCKQLISISFENFCILAFEEKHFPWTFNRSTDLQIFPLFHNIRFSSHFFVIFERIRKFWSLQYNEIPHFKPLSPTNDLDRIPLYTIRWVWYQVDTSNQNKETHQLGNYWLIPFQILQPNITLKCMADSKEKYGWNLESERVKTHMVIICTRQQINVSSNSSKVFLCIRNFRSHLN